MDAIHRVGLSFASCFAQSICQFKKKRRINLELGWQGFYCFRHQKRWRAASLNAQTLMAAGTRLGRWMFFGVIAVIAVCFVGALMVPWLQGEKELLPGRAFSSKEIGDFVHPVVVHQPDVKALIDSGEKDRNGNAVMVACADMCFRMKRPGVGGSLLVAFLVICGARSWRVGPAVY